MAIALTQSEFTVEDLVDAIERGDLDRFLLNMKNFIQQEFRNRLHPLMKRCNRMGMEYARYQLDAEEEISDDTLEVQMAAFALNRALELGMLLVKDFGDNADLIFREFEGALSTENMALLLWFTVGMSALEVMRFNSRIKQMLENEVPEERMKIRLQRIAKALYRDRADKIANTESNMAIHAGLISVWTIAKELGIIPPTVRKRWNVTWDEALCPLCEPLADTTSPLNSNVWSIGGVVIEEGVAIPRHPRCRCYYTLEI